jgi:hypothetical protein
MEQSLIFYLSSITAKKVGWHHESYKFSTIRTQTNNKQLMAILAAGLSCKAYPAH